MASIPGIDGGLAAAVPLTYKLICDPNVSALQANTAKYTYPMTTAPTGTTLTFTGTDSLPAGTWCFLEVQATNPAALPAGKYTWTATPPQTGLFYASSHAQIAADRSLALTMYTTYTAVGAAGAANPTIPTTDPTVPPLPATAASPSCSTTASGTSQSFNPDHWVIDGGPLPPASGVPDPMPPVEPPIANNAPDVQPYLRGQSGSCTGGLSNVAGTPFDIAECIERVTTADLCDVAMDKANCQTLYSGTWSDHACSITGYQHACVHHVGGNTGTQYNVFYTRLNASGVATMCL